MKTIKPSFEIWEQEPGLSGMYKQIERAGRICYKSEKNITADSAKPFVQRMIEHEHYAMLEHGTVYLTIPDSISIPCELLSNQFSVINKNGCHYHITTNLRVLAENNWMNLLKYFEESPKFEPGGFERRVTVHFTTQIAVTREYNRHRANSMAEQSTRYCNYSKNKFGGEIGINMPSWISKEELTAIDYTDDRFLSILGTISRAGINGTSLNAIDWWWLSNQFSEIAYMKLLECGWIPQQARTVLPLDTNTELVHTATISSWKHFFDLRALDKTGPAHPDAKTIALPLYRKFQELGYIY